MTEVTSNRTGTDRGFVDTHISCILKDFTFVRIHVDSLYISDCDHFLADIIRKKSIFGFVLNYQFPVLNTASRLHKVHGRVSAKCFNGNVIKFKHKRVLLTKITPETLLLWGRTPLQLTISAKLNTLGKFSIRKLGCCKVSLDKLTIPPFTVCGSYCFKGPSFVATALVTVDLGSRIRALMERLELTRGRVFGEARRKPRRARSVAAKLRDNPNASVPRLNNLQHSDNCCLIRRKISESVASPLIDLRRTASLRKSPQPSMERRKTEGLGYRVNLTVYSARCVPISYDNRGEAVLPSTYVTVIGEDGCLLKSPVCAGTTHPVWNWSISFNVPKSRQNVVVKLWKKCLPSDKVIGFISLQLPLADSTKVEYKMSNLSVSEQVPLIAIAMICEQYDTRLVTSVCPKSSPNSARLRTVSRENVFELLRRSMEEVEQMMARLDIRNRDQASGRPL